MWMLRPVADEAHSVDCIWNGGQLQERPWRGFFSVVGRVAYSLFSSEEEGVELSNAECLLERTVKGARNQVCRTFFS